MTINELKVRLRNPDVRITFGIDGIDLILAFENVLLKNGWKWRTFGSESGNISFIKYNPDAYKRILLYSNYNGNEPNRLSMSSCPTDFDFTAAEILITWDVIREFEKLLHPVPNYEPRKFVREI